MKYNPEITVNVRNIAFGGEGVGEVCKQDNIDDHLLGITAFVPFTVPGEQVRAQITLRKDRYLKAELLEIQQKSDSRVVPSCPYFGDCGGCDLQHITYEAQLEAKQQMLQGALLAARLDSSVLSNVSKIFPADPSFYYRRRVTLHLDQSGKLGFYRSNSRVVVPIQRCQIAVPEITECISTLAPLTPLLAGKISSIQLEVDDHGLVAVLRAPYDLTPAVRREIMKHARKYFSSALLVEGTKEVEGFGRNIVEVPISADRRLSLKVPVGSFSQVNFAVNLKLIKRVLELSQISKGMLLDDLYSGAGNFSIPLALAGAKVTAVEIDPRLIALGRENVSELKIKSNVSFVESSVDKFLDAHRSDREVEVIIADPPRSGLGVLVNSLTYAKRLLLISCQVPSLARDLKGLTECGWSIDSVEPFDMFAQSSHLEVLACLSR